MEERTPFQIAENPLTSLAENYGDENLQAVLKVLSATYSEILKIHLQLKLIEQWSDVTELKKWDSSGAQCLGIFLGQFNWVDSVAVSPDWRYGQTGQEVGILGWLEYGGKTFSSSHPMKGSECCHQEG
ncbi:hypothetical protein BKA69DRAFT_1123589 [Paraphysoderma sedebokerense]|nr:hypothetical protein BKA69DRAFT_1123589 [Paraphysoderma sedebokerense]